MTVFIVKYREAGYSELMGVFSTISKAEDAVASFDKVLNPGTFDIDEILLDFIIV
jgi:hypothetical protein